MCKTVSHSGLSSEYKHLFSRYYSFPKTLREFLVFLIEGTKKKKVGKKKKGRIGENEGGKDKT